MNKNLTYKQKLRVLAEALPYFPKRDSKGNDVKHQQKVKGEDLLKVQPGATHEGEPVVADRFYYVMITPCVDHYDELLKAYKAGKVAACNEYVKKVLNYKP